MFDTPWPAGAGPQDECGLDPYFVGAGEVDAARELVESTRDAERFLYAGDQHVFADSSLPSYDPDASNVLMRRVLRFLKRVDA